MRQWHCIVGGQQYGPISEEQLREWIAERRIGPADLVWTDGMAAWAPAASVPGLFGPGVTAASGVGSQTLVPPPGGSGGRLGIFQTYSRAWELMSGRWGVAIGFCVLIFLMYLGSMLLYCLGGPLWFMIFLAGPFLLSGAVFFLSYVRGAPVRVGMMWSGFRNYGTAMGAFWLTLLLSVLWILLGALPGAVILGVSLVPVIESGGEPTAEMVVLMVPGFIVLLVGYLTMYVWALTRYSQTMFLLADYPSMGVLNAIRRSIAMMRGHKFRLFLMLFIPWLIVFVVSVMPSLLASPVARTVGFGGILLVQVLSFITQLLLAIFGYPFLGACMAVFHDDLAPPPARAEAAEAPAGILPVNTPTGQGDGPVNPPGQA